MNIIVGISKDPILNLDRKVEVRIFQWNIETKSLKLFTVVRFYDINGIEVITERVKPYSVEMTGDNSTNIGTVSNYVGEYDYFMQQYFTNPVIIKNVIIDLIQSRDSVNKRFDI